MANIGDLASSFVATAPSPATSGTSLVVTAATGANYPAAPFYLTLTPAGNLSTFSTSEIVLVTAKSTDTFTITRAQKSTTAKSVAVGWIATVGIYASDLLSTITFGEVPSGLVNGANTVYTTSLPFTSIEVFKNGLRMKGGGADYTVTNNTTITMASAPASLSVLLVNYIMGNAVMISGSNSLITDQAPTGLVNSSNTSFVTANPYVAASLEVFINGVKQKRGTHFTESSPGTGTFTMSDAPLTGDDIMVNYQFQTGVSGNADTVDGAHAATTAGSGVIPIGDSNGRVSQAFLPLGTVVQQVSTNFSAVATGTTLFPNDDTIPQITEGNEFMTQAITPLSTTNVLVIDVTMMISGSVASAMEMGIWQDSTANALAAIGQYQAAVAGGVCLKLQHTMVAGTTSSTTFRVRGGMDNVGTVTFNGLSTARRYGGITVSNITITEKKA